MNNASSNDELQRVLDGNDQTDALLAGGWVRVLTVENKGLAMSQLMIHEAILKRKVALDHFCAGLKVLGVRELLMTHSKMMEPYFVAREQTPLSANAVLGLFEDISQQQSDAKKEQARQHLIKAITDLDVEGAVMLEYFIFYFICSILISIFIHTTPQALCFSYLVFEYFLIIMPMALQKALPRLVCPHWH